MVKRKALDIDEELAKEVETPPVVDEVQETPDQNNPSEQVTLAEIAPTLPRHYALKDFMWTIQGQLFKYQANQIISEYIQLKALLEGGAPIKQITDDVHQCPKCSHVFAGPWVDASK